ncbi:MAG: hypothetical protein IRY99_12020, partial [Isosphaeraceae bacterium]|nr:hypothetical protein [Isosphaeraceae bacterium]
GGSGSATGGGGTMMLNNEFLNPTGTPTPHEVRRQTFRAVFVGPFLQGPGRFDNVASTLYIKGAGSSTYFNHGDAQLGAFIPKDRSVPATGQLTSFDRNINANSAFSFDLVGDPQAVDRFGRPTRFTATVDVTTSSGIFVEAQGQGTVTIRYFPSGTHRPGVISEGKAIIVIKGQFYTLGTANILSVLGTHNSPGSSMYKL